MAKSISKSKTAINSVVFLILIVAMFAALNFLGDHFFKRLDLTENKQYTLSSVSKSLVQNLPDRMNIKLFMSDDLKPPFQGYAQYARDLLEEYASASGGKIHVEVRKIAENDKKGTEEAQKNHVTKAERGILGNNKLELGKIYLGISFDYHGKIESLPSIDRDEGLEFEISSLIKRMTGKTTKILFASSEGEPSLQSESGLRSLVENLRKIGYDPVSVELKASLPVDAQALIIIDPKQVASERAQFVVDQFLMKGKSVGFFFPGQVLQMPQMQGMTQPNMNMPLMGQATHTGFEDLLQSYGIKVRNDMILDSQNNVIGPVRIGFKVVGLNHPVFLITKTTDAGKTILTDLPGAILPYASSVDITTADKEGFVPLLETSKTAWRTSQPFIFEPDPKQVKAPENAEIGPFTMGYAASRKWKSFFAGKQMVKEDGTKVDVNQGTSVGESFLLESPEKTKMVVVGNADFMEEGYLSLANRRLGVYRTGLRFGVRMIEWLAPQPPNESLRPLLETGMKDRYIKQTSDRMVTFIKVANIGGVPVFVCLIGIILWQVRRLRRARASIK